MKKLHSSSLFLLSTLVGIGTGHSAMMITGNTADFNQEVNNSSALSLAGVQMIISWGLARSQRSAQRSTNAIFMFDLSSITAAVASATLTLNYEGLGAGNTPSFNVDLYGIGFSNTVGAGTSLTNYTVSASAPGTLITNNFVMPTSTAGLKSVTSTSTVNTSLVDYLNSNTGDLRYAFFRMNTDKGSAVTGGEAAYNFTSADATTNQPLLNVTVVPEPTSSMMLLGGAGMLMLRRRRR